MSGYKGFIHEHAYLHLKYLLSQIADTRGLENKLHHLYQPDTDMNDKICENFKISKEHIIADLLKMNEKCIDLMIKVAKLEES